MCCVDWSTTVTHFLQRFVPLSFSFLALLCFRLVRTASVKGHSLSITVAVLQIEMAALASDDELLHGEAVNIDMAFTTHVSRNGTEVDEG